ncbi:uncharacterized protein PFLUO_LOCUS1456 [Penicillium psychrofluorescens]|uniref:uncharacterized protein n=1 Tax=Penicillium psychrofluorescens TaxID=3158075 RepID=UPI003CCE099C
MSLTLKLSSLAIRTFSKPIATQIKAQAREHERFRHLCVSMAQALHRFDMRLRLGSLRDDTAAQKLANAEKEVRKHKSNHPTVKTQAETKAEADADTKAKAAAEEAAKPRKYHIRPLSESKAIESGANFISETFLFLVAGGLIVFESWRSRRKESTRREGVEDRLNELEESEKASREALVALEKEILQLRAKHGDLSKPAHRILPRQVWDVEEETDTPPVEEDWFSRITSYFSFGQSQKAPPPPEPAPATPSTDSKSPSVSSKSA